MEKDHAATSEGPEATTEQSLRRSFGGDREVHEASKAGRWSCASLRAGRVLLEGRYEVTEALEAVDQELNRLIEKRTPKETDPDEQEELWKASVREYNRRRREENRQAWAAFHEGQAERHRRTLKELIAHHEAKATKLLKGKA